MKEPKKYNNMSIKTKNTKKTDTPIWILTHIIQSSMSSESLPNDCWKQLYILSSLDDYQFFDFLTPDQGGSHSAVKGGGAPTKVSKKNPAWAVTFLYRP